MQDSENHRELLLAYMLGELSAAEREAVESRMILDEDFSSALEEAEYDLRDAYRAGELGGEQALRVRRALYGRAAGLEEFGGSATDANPVADLPLPLPADGAAEVGRGRTQGGRDLSAEGSAARQRPAPAPLVVASRRRGISGVGRAAAGLGAAAAVALAALWLHSGSRRMLPAPPPVASLQAAVPGRPPAAGSPPQPPAATGGPAASPAVPAAGSAKAPASLPGPAVLTLVLPALTRGPALGVHAPARVRVLRVEWERTAEAAAPLLLRVSEGDKVVASVSEQDGGPSRAAVFPLPLASLAAGSYLFRVEDEAGNVYGEAAVELSR